MHELRSSSCTGVVQSGVYSHLRPNDFHFLSWLFCVCRVLGLLGLPLFRALGWLSCLFVRLLVVCPSLGPDTAVNPVREGLNQHSGRGLAGLHAIATKMLMCE